MYANSSVLKRLPDMPLTLWRYISVDRLVDLLREGSMYFANLTTFRDGREGALTNRTHSRLVHWVQVHEGLSLVDAHAQVDQYLDHQRHFYVNCWHMNLSESYLMWKAYADCGVAIKTTAERLRASFSSNAYSVTGGVVDYVDFERDFTPVGNVFNHVATKDLPYADEKEFRVVFWALDASNSSVCASGRGVRLPVDVDMLISGVVENPFLPKLDAAVRRLLDSKGIPVVGSRVREKA